eukprot:scaffold269419_cov16-Tisochrysis_lutea.AAC.4
MQCMQLLLLIYDMPAVRPCASPCKGPFSHFLLPLHYDCPRPSYNFLDYNGPPCCGPAWLCSGWSLGGFAQPRQDVAAAHQARPLC